MLLSIDGCTGVVAVGLDINTIRGLSFWVFVQRDFFSFTLYVSKQQQHLLLLFCQSHWPLIARCDRRNAMQGRVGVGGGLSRRTINKQSLVLNPDLEFTMDYDKMYMPPCF